MNLRRERIHQMGGTNLYQESGSFSTPQANRTQPMSFSTISKAKKFDDILEKRMTKPMLSPISKSQIMYQSAGKLIRSKTLVGYPRAAQLEEEEKRKLVFTGDSVLLFDKKLEKYRDTEFPVEGLGNGEAQKKEHLAKEKHNIHGNAVHETQLVGYDKHSADTLKNNVNLEKVREARRVLRRRYASRKNLFSIYNAWDEDHTGAITIENVYNMAKKMGLNLNVDESRVLLASANKTGSGELALDEFLDLIYNKDDVLNVDLDHLAQNLGDDYLIKREELEKGDDNIIKKLEKDAKRTREVKHLNQTNLILKNHLNEIAHAFIEADPAKLGYINFEKFDESLKKLAINKSVVSDDDIKRLFEKHRSDAHVIDYRNFVEALKKFQFQFDEQYKDQSSSSPRSASTKIPLKPETPEKYHIVDCRDLPYHSTVEYLGRTRKVNRAIKRFFPAKEDFYKYLSETMRVNKEKIEGHYVNSQELKTFVDDLFKNFDKVDVGKPDFEKFLSAFIYNKQGDTNLKEVARVIYEEEDKEFFDKINFRKKGPGPRREYAEDSKEDADEYIISPSLKLRRNLSQPAGKVSSLPSVGAPGLEAALQKIDDYFFIGTKKAYEVFKNFDVDKDGYISRKDLASKLKGMAILSNLETQTVLDFVDPEKRGYVSFQEFSSKIRPNMLNQKENGEFKVIPFTSPSKEVFEKTMQTIPETKLKVKQLISTYQADNSADKYSRTRYGASPSWSNTFQTFQAHSRSPMYISESDRFDRHHNARVKFQFEENDKKKQVDNERLRTKQKFAAMLSERVENQSLAVELRDEGKRAKKLVEQTRYEQRAKLFNSYI